MQGPRRPQGSRQDVPDRAERRALRALAGGDRAGARASRGSAQRRGGATALAEPVHLRVDASALAAERDRRPQAGDRGLPRPGRGRCSTSTRARARAGCASARPTACSTRRRCAPSSSTRSRRCRRAGDRPERRASARASARARRGRARAGARRARLPCAAGPSRFSPGVSSTHGSLCSEGAERNAAQPSLAELARADVGVAVAVGAERRLRVVEVQRADRARGRACASLAQHARPCRRACGCHSRRRAGGRSPGTRRGARRRRPPRAARRARRTSARACRRRRPCSPGAARSPRCRRAPARSSRRRARSPRRRRPVLAEPGAGRRRAAPIAVPDAQRVGQRGERFGADLAVLARAVEQVDGVDQHGVDRAGGHRLAEGRDVLLAVGRRFPHARRLVEDLDRPAAALDAALDRLGQAAGGRDVRAD